MSFCDDREDIYSIALTAVQNLMEHYNVSYKDIGRLEVGTETLLDKAKSVKTVIMQLFAESGNYNVEGVDTINACYGGTNALFNAVNWVESSSWDGRLALVVAGDIAIYAEGSARPTGGAGCVAMLVGPGAPIVFDRALKGSHMEHAYDFYKPDLSSEYPIVDGHFSIACNLRALDSCYNLYMDKLMKKTKSEKPLTALDFDHILFHAPFCKQVQKSYARLFYNDYRRNNANPLFANVSEAAKNTSVQDSLTNKDIEKEFSALSKSHYSQYIVPSLLAATQVGNMYTAALYATLASLICASTDVSPGVSSLQDKRIGFFSYGSGLASTFFSASIKGDISPMRKALDLQTRLLEQRKGVTADEFEKIMELREKTHHLKDYKPSGNVEELFDGTYYLVDVDDKYRRTYKRKGESSRSSGVTINGVTKPNHAIVA